MHLTIDKGIQGITDHGILKYKKINTDIRL